MQRPLAFAILVLALAPLAAAQKASTPRELLERAHYAEENQHDLAAAEKGYREASAAAAKAGDAKLAAEADAALERVLVRLGKKEAPQQQELPETVIDLLMSSTHPSANHAQMVEDLQLYGDVIVPALEKMLGPPGQMVAVSNSRTVETNPAFAALALASIDTPQARKLLEGAMRSKDPLRRRYVVTAAVHVELLLMAAEDPVPAIREAAVVKLKRIADLRAAPLMEEEAKRGDTSAFRWLAKNSWQRAFELVDAGAIPAPNLGELEGWSQSLPLEMAEFLVERGRSARNLDLRVVARQTVQRMLKRHDLNSTLEWRLDLARRTGDPNVMAALQGADPSKLLPTLIEIAQKDSGVMDPVQSKGFEDALVGVQDHGSLDLGTLGTLYAALSARTDWSRGPDNGLVTVLNLIARNTQEANDAQFIELITRLTPQERPWWKEQVGKWAERRIQARVAKGEDMIPPPGSFPSAHLVAAKLLIEERMRTGLIFLAGIQGESPAALLRATLDELQKGTHDLNSPTVHVLIERAAQANATKTLEELWKSTEGAAREGRDANAQAFLVSSLKGLPLEPRIELMRRTWKAPLAEGLRAVAMQEFLSRGQGSSDPQYLNTLLELYPGVPAHQNLRPRVLSTFQSALYEPAIPLLGDALRSSDASLRSVAQAAFADFRKQREALEELDAWLNASSEQRATIAELRALLASPERDVVIGAVRALGALKARTALPELVKLLSRDDAELKAALQAAIAGMEKPQ